MAHLAQNNRVRILLVEDHPLVRQGLRLTIGEDQDAEVCGKAGDRENTLAAVQASRPVLVIMEVQLKNSSGLDLTRHLLEQHPNTDGAGAVHA